MMWAEAFFLAFLLPGSQMASNWKGRMYSVTKTTGSSVAFRCDIHRDQGNFNYVHWYQVVEGKAPRHLLFYSFIRSNFIVDSGLNPAKYHAYEGTERSCNLVLRNLERSDSGIYYCAVWAHAKSGWIMKFGEGTKLIVTSEKTLQGDISPKPTIFLPSIAEINHHKAGTYLCLLEKFFPDVINVYWKEKDDNKILESQQGTTVRTNDTYMKFSWLTVSGKAINKEHRCIVGHEKNIKEVDQEILFPPIKKASTTYVKNENASTTYVKNENDVFQQQLTNTYAYYTYLLLLVKSAIHLAIVAFCLIRRTAVCDNGKTS